MSAYTPGPWIQAPLSPLDIVTGTVPPPGCIFQPDQWVATAREGLNTTTRAEALANARLIAAAPQLVQALFVAYADIQRIPNHHIGALDRIEEALRAAGAIP